MINTKEKSQKYFKREEKIMKEVSKFIPLEGNGGEVGENGGTVENCGNGTENSTFKVCETKTNLPAKQSFWSKLRGILTYEIKVELTPYQQKIEDEINEFLHQEITWQGFRNFLFQDITFGKKNKANN